MSGDEADKKYVVVETTYPTTYGCYTSSRRGRPWSEYEMLRRMTFEASSDDKYDSLEQTIEAAKKVRDQSGWFDCAEEGQFDHDPPYDSAVMKNYDNDEEIRIQVMTVAKYHEMLESREEAFMKVAAEEKYEHVKKRKMERALVKHANRVFYCYPPPRDGGQDWSHPAQVEIDDTAESLKSLVKAKDQGSREIETLKYEPQTMIDYSKDDCVLFQVLSQCPSLQELHLHMKLHVPKNKSSSQTLQADFFNKLLSCQPKLKQTLRVLSIQHVYLSPEAVRAIRAFSALEHLDIPDTFDYEEILNTKAMAHGCYDELDEEEPEYPYGKAVKDGLGRELLHLKRLDLGYGGGDGEMRSMLVDELVGSRTFHATHRLLCRRGGRGVTVTRGREPCGEWATRTAEKSARRKVLQDIAHQKDDPFIAALAENDLEQL